jgi:hypothetical protein
MIHQHVHARFHEVFGKPDSSLGRDDHWSLSPGPDRASINILVNGSAQVPAVWVFDPHSRHDGVMRTAIETEQDVEEAIKAIQARVRSAKQVNPPQKQN